MRGLLFIGGDRPDMKNAARFFGAWDAVFAADSGIYGALEAGLEPDCIVGDMDSLEHPDILESIGAGRIVRAECDKDYTDTELALGLMVKEGFDDIVLVGGGGGRLDHFFALERLFAREHSPQIWIGTDTVAWLIDSSGQRTALALTGLANEPVSVFPVGPEPHVCQAEGLFWPVDHLDWDNGGYSLSNRARDGNCSLRAQSGRFLVIAPLEGRYSVS